MGEGQGFRLQQDLSSVHCAFGRWNLGDQCLTLFGLPALDMGANPRAPRCPQALVRRHSGVLGWARSLCPSQSLRSFPSLQQKTF